jgi:hypothetical protein
MNVLKGASTGELWVVLLGAGITLVVLTAIVGILIAWKERPIKRDEAQQHKLHERLLDIAQTSGAAPRKSFPG